MDREYPDKPIVGVGAIIFRDDDVLLIRRGKPPRKDQWSLPGGAQEVGETVEEALIREIREETSAEIAIGGFVEVVDYIERDKDGRARMHYTLLDYWGEWLSGDLAAGGDVTDAVWAAQEDLGDYDLWDKTQAVIATARRIRAGTPPAPLPTRPATPKKPLFAYIDEPHTLKGHARAAGIAALFGLGLYAVIMVLVMMMKWFGVG